MKVSDLRNILSVQLDKESSNKIAPMTLEYMAETLYFSYFRHGAIFCESIECNTPQHEEYWKVGIDAAELSRELQRLKASEIELLYDGSSLSIHSEEENMSLKILIKSDYVWGQSMTTIPSNEFETYTSFTLDAKAYEVMHSAGKIAQRGNGKVYVHVTSGKMLAITAYNPTQVTYQGCFSVNDSRYQVRFSLPYEIIHSFMDYDFQRVHFSFDLHKQEIFLESAQLNVLLPWEPIEMPYFDALLESYSSPTEIKVKDLTKAIAECAKYSALLGVSALEAPDANEITLTGGSSSSAIGISGIYKSKQLGKGRLDDCEVTVDAIALMDALHDIRGESVNIHFPQEPLTPLQIESDSQLYMFMPRIKEERQYDPWQQIDEDHLFPHSEVIFEGRNGDNSRLQIIKVEESPLEEHLPWSELNRYIDGLYLEHQTTNKNEIRHITLVDDNIELHHALVELQKQLENAEGKQKKEAVKLLKRAINITTQVIDKNDLGEAYDGTFKEEFLSNSLDTGIWLGGRLHQALNNVTDVTYRLELVID